MCRVSLGRGVGAGGRASAAFTFICVPHGHQKRGGLRGKLHVGREYLVE